VDAAEQRRDIDQPMELLPAPAQAAHGRAGRSQRQRHQQHQAGEADRDVGPLHDVLQHDPVVETLVDEQVEEEVPEQVEEGCQAEHAAQADPVDPSGQLSQRRDAERDQEEVQSPLAQRMQDLLDRVGAERNAADAADAGGEPGKRRQAAQQYQRLEDEPCQSFLRQRHRQKNLARSMPAYSEATSSP